VKRSLQDRLATALVRLGVRARGFTTPQVVVGTRRVVASRAVVDGLPWLQFGGATRSNATTRLREVTLVAALTDRIPVVGVIHLGTGDLTQVQLPGWAFAALLKMVAECPSDTAQMVLSEYLPLGLQMTEADREMASGIASSLEGQGRFSSSTSD